MSTEECGTTAEFSEKPFEVGMFRPEDAQGIVRLFHEVYGDAYPIKLFYDEQAIVKANAEGQYYSIVVRDPQGAVVGVQHLYRSAPFASLYEFGLGLVTKDYRGMGVFNTSGTYITTTVVQRLNIEAAFGESVCYHLHSQKLCSRTGFRETALEVALMPSETYTKEKEGTGRVAALLQFHIYRHRAHKIYVPPAYEKEFAFLYGLIDVSREMATSTQEVPEDLTSQGEITIFDFAQVARIVVHKAGIDFADWLTEMESRALSAKCLVIQVFLKLSSPWVGRIVDVVRARGYFVGGALPRWFDDDGLLMQKLLCEPDFDDIQLFSDDAKRILDLVKEDWDRAQCEHDHR